MSADEAGLTVICAGCGAGLPQGARFCSQCGQVLSQDSSDPADSGDRRVVTVLFTDISGFTSLSERLDPAAVAEIVNDFFAVLTEPIYRYGGVVDKYIGDAIMALFGAPVAHEDDPERAVHAAFEMQQAAAAFSERLMKEQGVQLRIRIGLNTGLVFAGAVGSQEKQGYSVLGNAVNMAQRMESSARPGTVLVARETYRRTHHRFDYLAYPLTTGKKATKPFEGYELVGPRPQADETPHGRHPFVGRALELERLQLAWQGAQEGLPHVVMVSAEGGLGKSRLVAEFARHLRTEPILLKARSQSFTKQSSFALLAALLHDWLGTSPLQPLAKTRATLLARCTASGMLDPERRTALLGAFLGIDLAGSDFETLSQEQRRQLASDELAAWLLDLTARAPAVLLWEDLQWADEASLEWIKAFLASLSIRRLSPRLLTVIQVRGENPVALPPHGAFEQTVIRLRPLAPAEMIELLAALLQVGQAGLEGLGELTRLVTDRADGNPFYLTELVLSLEEHGDLVRGSDGWQLKRSLLDLVIPATVQGVLAARLDRLPRRIRSLLQLASVLGRTFASPVVARMSGDHPAPSDFAHLVQEGYLQSSGSESFSFVQAAIQEVAYQSLLLSKRRDLHGRAAHALEALYPEHLDEHAQVLADHFLQAGLSAQGLLYQYRAARRAFELYDLPVAHAAIERALAIAEPAESGPARWELRSLEGQVLTALARYEEALGAFETAYEAAEDSTVRARMLRAQGDVHERQGNYPAALACYHRGLEVLPAGAALEQATSLSKIALVKYRLGAYDDCQELCFEALSLLEGLGAAGEEAFIHSCLGIAFWRQGRFEPAIHHTREAMVRREAARDLLGLAKSSNNLATIYADTGDAALAEQYYRASLEAYERIGDAYNIVECENNLGAHLLMRGALPEAERHLNNALQRLEGLQAKQLHGIVLFNLGDVRYHQGDLDGAIESVQAAIALFTSIGAREVFPEVYRKLGEIYVATGRFEAAQEALSKARGFAEEDGDLVTPGIVSRIQAAMAFAQGDVPAARRWLSQSIAGLLSRDVPLELGRSWALLARVAAGTPEGQDAQARAKDLFAKLGAEFDLLHLAAAE